MPATPPRRARAQLLALLLAVAGGGALAHAVPVEAAEIVTERAPLPAPVSAPPPAEAEPPAAPAASHARESAPPPPAEVASCVEAGDSNDVPRVVADIFRCRLTEAGVATAEARRIATEAVVIAHCESKFDPNAVVFDGRYVDRPHPSTGDRFSAAGVFQIIRRVADQWVDGGYAQVRDPRRNIDAAARLFIHNRARGYGGWGEWACAAANDGFKVGSVLPGWPGGPAALPGWAEEYVS